MKRGFLAAGVFGLVACASGGAPKPDLCEVEVGELRRWDVSASGVRIAYAVHGRAGSPAKVWLAARNPSGTWVSGTAVEVGPGSFAAEIGLGLDRRPERYAAVLQVAGRRCRDDAPMPSR